MRSLAGDGRAAVTDPDNARRPSSAALSSCSKNDGGALKGREFIKEKGRGWKPRPCSTAIAS
jgi:hypothetical protein